MPPWKRYQVQTPVESTHTSAARPKTKVLSAHVQRDIAIQLLRLFDAWSKSLRYQPTDSHSAQKTRDQIASGNKGIKLGFSVPPEQMAILEGTPENDYRDGLITLHNRKKNWIATWCIENGIDELTVAKLRAEYARIRPSLSLVTLLAFTIGLDRFCQNVPPAPPDPKTVKSKPAVNRWSAKQRASLAKKFRQQADALSENQKDLSRRQSLIEMAKLVETAPAEVLDQLLDQKNKD